jgi:hypothetical protein
VFWIVVKANLCNCHSLPNYNVKRLVAWTTNMCNGAVGMHIFFGSATGPLELALGTVPTRGGGA